MVIKGCEIRTIDNGFVIRWYDENGSHEEIVSSLSELKTKLVELYSG